MSEYQFYEWQTIDRPLTTREQADVNQLSSHMDTVTPSQAIVTYSWGDFKHDPKQVLLKYFDAFLYDSNFGVRELMFRLPRDLVDVNIIRPFLFEDAIMLEEHEIFYVLQIEISDESDLFEWIESEGVLSQLTPLREQLLEGDTRVLYLAWLKMISMNDPQEWKDEPEPPVPAGLKKLNDSLQAFAEFFEIDPHLISAAAQKSKPVEPMSEPDIESAIAKLTREESNMYLAKIVRYEPGAVLSLKKRLADIGGTKNFSLSPSTRLAGELFKQAGESKTPKNLQRRKKRSG